MKKINILQVKGTMNRGGAEEFLMNVLRKIDSNKYSFIFLCYGNDKFDYEEEIITLGAKIVRIDDVKSHGPLKQIGKIREVIRNENIHVIHAHTYFNSVLSLIAGKREGVSVRIAHAHTSLKGNEAGPIKSIYASVSRKRILKNATTLIACGKEAGKAFYGTTNFKIIRNGIITENFSYNLHFRDSVRSALGINKETTVIGHVGRITKPKNHKFILNVLDEYLKLNKDTLLVLVGDGPLRQNLESRATLMKLSDNIKWLGTRDDVVKLYSMMDVLIFPSLWEGLPLTLVEAQVNGLAILASDVIDTDVKFTNKLQQICLNVGPETWAKELFTMSEGNSRSIISSNDSEYNIITSVKKLTELYDIAKDSGVYNE